MFDILKSRTMPAAPDPAERSGKAEPTLDELRARIVELEEENAHLLRLDETIRKNARLFRAILEKCREGIGLLTPDLIVLRLIHSSVGYQEMEVSGQPFLPLIHPDDAASFLKSFSYLLNAQAKSISCEFRLAGKDGGWAWLAGELTDMLDDPDVQAILLNVRNITDHKRQIAAIETLESYHACPEYAMFLKNLQGVVLDWNPGAEKAFGYSSKEMVGQQIAILVPPKLLGEEISICERVAAGEPVPAFQTVRMHKDGRGVAIHLKLTAVRDASGAVTAIAHLSHVIGPAMPG